ncbi:hypothetical protein C8Q80DRAFT_262767 [Daedaleopsis nitida]|nr:hypothetical protein C8Q80DRAFT_262767 [Daedaleopsis nitida]
MDAELPDQRETDGPQEMNWNSTRPINRLPIELFIEMIQMTKVCLLDDMDWAFIQPMSFIPLSSVCSLWRHVVCTTPQLWREVHIHNNLHWLNLCLQRSIETPIHIYLHSPTSLSSSLGVLSNHAHRIRAMTVLHTAPGTVELLTTFVRPSMTLLTDLSIDNQDCQGVFASVGDSIGPSILPALRVLRLHSVYMDWFSPSIHHLRVLHLRDWPARRGEYLTLAQFLRVLEACEALESLTLDFALPFDTYGADSEERDVSGPIVTLANIRTFYILCPPAEDPCSPDMYHLLSHLTLPASAAVQLYTQIELADTYDEGGFLDTVPADPERLPILRTATIAHVWRNGFNVDVDRFDPYVHTESERRGHLGVQLEPVGDPDAVEEWAYTHDLALKEFGMLLGRAPLRELKVHVEHLSASEETWRLLFRTFGELTKLTIEGMYSQGDTGTSDDVVWLRALSRCGSQSHTDTDTDTDTATDAEERGRDSTGVLLAKLRRLHIVDMPRPLEEGKLKMIADCLRLRDAQGVRLSELRLQVEGAIAPFDDHQKRLFRDIEMVVDGTCVYTNSSMT